MSALLGHWSIEELTDKPLFYFASQLIGAIPSILVKYFQIIDGEGFSLPTKAIHRLACCDCGLVHDIVLVNGRGHVGVAMRRNKRATAARRKLRKGGF